MKYINQKAKQKTKKDANGKAQVKDDAVVEQGLVFPN